MLENVYEGLNARPKVYLSNEYFCEMYPTCVSSELCGFIQMALVNFAIWVILIHHYHSILVINYRMSVFHFSVVWPDFHSFNIIDTAEQCSISKIEVL